MRTPKQPNKEVLRKRAKREIIRLMEEGSSFGAAVRRLLLKSSTVYGWRRSDDIFGEKIKQLLEDPAHKARGARSETQVIPEDDWKKAFAKLLTDGKKRTEALDVLGLSAVDVKKALADDEDFRRLLEEIEIRNVWDIEDNAIDRAKVSTADARLVLSSALREKYGDSKPEPNASKAKKALYRPKGLDEADEWLDNMAHKPRGVIS